MSAEQPFSLAVPPELVEAIAVRVAQLVRSESAAAVADPWLDVQAAADHLACQPHRIYDLVAEGRLQCAKDGRRSLFRREWLDAYLLDPEGS